MNEYHLQSGLVCPDIHESALKAGGQNPSGNRLGITNRYLTLDGEPFYMLSGEFQFSRYPNALWEREICKMKAAGLNTIASYLFWIHHEAEQGVFRWDGDNNLRRFIQLCRKHGMYVLLRIGPFDNGECRSGGIPDWVFGYPFDVRTNNEQYIGFVRCLYNEIGKQAEGLMYKDGGPVIGIQLENEYNCVNSMWEATRNQDYVSSRGEEGEAGAQHMRKLKELAVDAGLVAPLYAATSWGESPVVLEEMLPVHGAYSEWPWTINEKALEHCQTNEYLFYNFYDNDLRCQVFNPCYEANAAPYAALELGGGSQHTYNYRYQISPESVEAMAKTKVGCGMNLISYYLYHGVTHPTGMTTPGFPSKSYDFQAPLTEYGQTRESGHRLRLLSHFLTDFSEQLLQTEVVLPEGNAAITADNNAPLRFSARLNGASGFLFLNNYQDHLDMPDKTGLVLHLQLADETLRLPHTGSFTLKSEDCAIFPLHLDMGGVCLRYALTQLITRIENGDETTWFFHSNEGISAEYSFAAAHIKAIRSASGAVVQTESGYIVTETPSLHSELLIETADGKRIRVVTLTRAEALSLWRLDFAGRTRVLFTTATVAADGGDLRLYSLQNRETLRIYPAEGCEYLSDTYARDGIYGCFSLETAARELDYTVQYHAENRLELIPGAGMLDGDNEVYFTLRYTGDVGRAFIRGLLKADDFYNGDPWTIGLRRFAGELQSDSLCIHISPQRKGEMVVRNAAVGLKEDFVGEETVSVDSVTVAPEYSFLLKGK